MEKSGSPEVQKFSHYDYDTLLSGTHTFDGTPELPDFRTSPFLVHPSYCYTYQTRLRSCPGTASDWPTAMCSNPDVLLMEGQQEMLLK